MSTAVRRTGGPRCVASLSPVKRRPEPGALCYRWRTVEPFLIALALLVLPLALFVALQALDRRRRDEEHRQWMHSVEAAWESLVLQTSDLRLSIVEGTPRLHGLAAGSRFKVVVDHEGRVALEAQASLPQGFSLFVAPIFTAAGEGFTTGDGDFDAAFVVTSTDTSLAASLLGPRVRAALLSISLQEMLASATELHLSTSIDPSALDRAALDAMREVIAAVAGSSAPEAAEG